MKKGQGAFEYILILAAVLFIVILALLLLSSLQVVQSAQVEQNACRNDLAGAPACFQNGVWKANGQVTFVGKGCNVLFSDNKANYAGIDCSTPPLPNSNFYYYGPAAGSVTGWCCGPDPRT